MALSANLQLKNLITEDIDDRFCYIQYDEFDLIMMKENRYLNASKLCKLGGKKLSNWIRLDGSKNLIDELNKINKIWKLDHNSRVLRSEQPKKYDIILEIKGSNRYTKDVSGSYVHQDLIPHICSWISPLFAVKVSKIVNCFMSDEYEFRLKEKEDKIDKLLNKLDRFQEKYDNDVQELKEQNNDLKEQNNDLKLQNNKFQEKYDTDTKELNDKLNIFKKNNKKINKKLNVLKSQNNQLVEDLNKKSETIEKKQNRIIELVMQLRDKIIKSNDPNKEPMILILYFEESETFKIVRGQKKRINLVKKQYEDRAIIFYCAYEPNPITFFDRLRSDLISEGKLIFSGTNDFKLDEDYSQEEFTEDLEILGLERMD